MSQGVMQFIRSRMTTSKSPSLLLSYLIDLEGNDAKYRASAQLGLAYARYKQPSKACLALIALSVASYLQQSDPQVEPAGEGARNVLPRYASYTFEPKDIDVAVSSSKMILRHSKRFLAGLSAKDKTLVKELMEDDPVSIQLALDKKP